MKVDDIIAGIMRLGRGSLMAKFDVQNAYRIVPVHTEDRQLLGMKWRGAFYVDMVLPFGVWSAPYIFTCVADLVEWVAKQNYDVTFLVLYLDDFHTLGPPGSSVCQHNLDRSTDCFSKLGVPLQWAFKRVNFLSDNRSVVDILRSGTSRAPTIMSLVRCPCWQLVTPSSSLPPQLAHC